MTAKELAAIKAAAWQAFRRECHEHRGWLDEIMRITRLQMRIMGFQVRE